MAVVAVVAVAEDWAVPAPVGAASRWQAVTASAAARDNIRIE
ncbi:hypothetical protein GCM10027430_05920 [Lysobacter tyrosinilyticus]